MTTILLFILSHIALSVKFLGRGSEETFDSKKLDILKKYNFISLEFQFIYYEFKIITFENSKYLRKILLNAKY